MIEIEKEMQGSGMRGDGEGGGGGLIVCVVPLTHETVCGAYAAPADKRDKNRLTRTNLRFLFTV